MSSADPKSKSDPGIPATVLPDSERCRIARDVIAHEAAAVAQIAAHLGPQFDQAVELILQASGRVIVTGMGKSGLIGQKIAATLSSTGTPAFFLHPVEAGHGDMGVVGTGDVVVAISKSAASDEIGELLPAFKRLGTPIILITGNPGGELAQRADVVLDTSVESEADTHNLVPTCSTTTALVMGDALAVTLLSERGFTPEQFAQFHPKGALGRRLLLTVSDLMHAGPAVPLVADTVSFKELLFEMTRKRVGAAGVVDADGRLIGIFTDGDLRRAVEQRSDLFELHASDVMTPHPKAIAESELAVTALTRMEESKITVLFVTDPDNRPVGVLHMHDILSAGVA
jgi:arabinose-5-phosphate isomerase